MSELYFRAGETEGFTSKKLADKKSGYSNPIRELLQNSLDASIVDLNEKCEIHIYIESIKTSDIPHIKDYEYYLKQAIEFQKSVGSFRHNAKQTVDFMEKALEQVEMDILMFVDNGIGMSPDILNGLIGERSVKPNENSGGSFGVGHLSPYFLSSLRYILYASKYREDGDIKTLFSGAPILAGFKDTDGIERGSIGRLLSKKPENELSPEYNFLEKLPDFIHEKFVDIVTGSMVGILGLNNKWSEEANYAIVSNFFYAINKSELNVNIHRTIADISIDKHDIENILFASREKKVATRGNILSGSDTYQLWLTVKNDNWTQEINLDNGDKVCAHIRNNIETNSAVAMVRNGMLIARHDGMLSTHINTLRQNAGFDFEPFSILINIDNNQCPKLYELVKGAENPYHNQLERDRLSPSDEEKLIKLLKELSEKIREYLIPRERGGSLISMPELEIPNQAQAEGATSTRPTSQTPKAKSRKITPKSPPKKPNEGKGKKRPQPIIVSRALDSINAARFLDNGDTIDVIMSVQPKKINTKDDVYFSVSLAMDTDNDSVDLALEFTKLSVNGEDVALPEFVNVENNGEITSEAADNRQIKIGKLSELQTHDIVATIKKPKKVENIGVALKPFLGLRQVKGGSDE